MWSLLSKLLSKMLLNMTVTTNSFSSHLSVRCVYSYIKKKVIYQNSCTHCSQLYNAEVVIIASSANFVALWDTRLQNCICSWLLYVPNKMQIHPTSWKTTKKKLELLFQSKDCKKYILNVLLFLTTQRFSFVYILQSIKVKDCITYYPSIHHLPVHPFIHWCSKPPRHQTPPWSRSRGQQSKQRSPDLFLQSTLSPLSG